MRRPFDPKQALHVVLRSSQARGACSLLHPRNCNPIRDLANRLGRRWGIRIYRFANVGNHLHLVIRARTRANWQGFIREFSGGTAMLVTGAKKGNALPRKNRNVGPPRDLQSGLVAERSPDSERAFWDHLVYTRIVKFGRDFDFVCAYVLKNLWEGAGVPVRRLLARGLRVLELSDDGLILLTPALQPKSESG